MNHLNSTTEQGGTLPSPDLHASRQEIRIKTMAPQFTESQKQLPGGKKIKTYQSTNTVKVAV